MLASIKNLFQKTGPAHSEKEVAEAYDIWSDFYDFQPGNLMLDLDEQILTDLLENVNLKDRVIADIGCGTGRHWSRLYDKNPSAIIGFDVSSGMLSQLRQKFPAADSHLITDDRISILPDASIDFLLSTLTLAHIKDPREAIHSWSRVLKKGGQALITDFHPVMLQKGGRRSFPYEGRTLSVVNYIHPLKSLKDIFQQYGMFLIRQEEKWMDESVKHYYTTQGALPVFNRFKGTPIIYGLLLNKPGVTE